MDFTLNREQELVRKMMRAFAENEVKPIAAEIDRECTYPRENVEKLFKLGVMGMTVPKHRRAGTGLRVHQRYRGRSLPVLRPDSGSRHGGAEEKISADAD